MSQTRSRISLIIAIVFTALGLITFPGSFRYCYERGTGQAYIEIQISENLPLHQMTYEDLAPYRARAESVGLKCALLTTFGSHFTFILLILITIGLLTHSITHGVRVFLRFAFLGVWIIGMLLFSLGYGYLRKGYTFLENLSSVFIVYILVIAFFGAILGIGKLIQRATVRKQIQ